MAYITCYSEINFGGLINTYTQDNPDITVNGPVMSCQVRDGTVTVYQYVDYKGASSQLAVGDYSDNNHFPDGIQSLKV